MHYKKIYKNFIFFNQTYPIKKLKIKYKNKNNLRLKQVFLIETAKKKVKILYLMVFNFIKKF